MGRELATVRAIAVRGPGTPGPASMERALAVTGCGLAGDMHADARSPRQVLLAGAPAYRSLGLPPHALRENLLLDVDTAAMASGTVLRIGTQVRLRLSFQCEACGDLDRHAPGLARAIGARRGILARVLAGGEIRLGDPVIMLEQRLSAMPEEWRERVARVIEAVFRGEEPEGVDNPTRAR